MSDNDNLRPDGNNDPFSHPIKNNNWWLYLFGGLVLGGLIAWFFIDWSYKNRDKNPDPLPTEKQIEKYTGEPEVALPEDSVVLGQQEETLPQLTVEGEETK